VDFTVDTPLPLSRGYVHLSVHNHAMIKYTQPDTFPAIVDATVAQIDNFGFDGPVIEGWREYEVPDSLVRFSEPLGDPYNTEDVGYDIGYFVNDEAEGPRQVLHLEGVDIAGATSARLAFSSWFLHDDANLLDDYAFRVRLNGNEWLERKLSAEEIRFLSDGPTVVDPDGAPYGDPASQGRVALLLDVPLEHLVAGDNTVEVVTANVPTNYPPIVCNVDLVLQTR
jgi:hypothetical protein